MEQTKRIPKVLVACEESQAVTIELRKLGIEAYSCDLLPCSGGHPEWHLQQDVVPLLKEKWDMIIAFPPCTYMSKAGARWMYKGGILQEDRLKKAMQAKDFFNLFYNHPCNKIVVENPVPLKIIGLPEPTQKKQPYEFGHPYSKKTCLWIKGLPKLKPTNILKEYTPYLPSNTSQFAKGKGGSRGVAHTALIASKTFQGIAKAMAEQWGGKLLHSFGSDI